MWNTDGMIVYYLQGLLSCNKNSKNIVAEAVLKAKESKVCGPSCSIIEVDKAGAAVMQDVITDMINLTIKEEQFLTTGTTQ